MALNPADVKIAEFTLIANMMLTLPASPGMNFYGPVAATGSSVDDFRLGNMVFGKHPNLKKFGALAQYTVADASVCCHAPPSLDPIQAPGLGTAALTAYQCIVPFVSAGCNVFINGGSGGRICEELGADAVIDYRIYDVTKSLVDEGQVYDLVVDNVGSPLDLYKKSHPYMKPAGRYIQIASATFSQNINSAKNYLLPSFLGGGKRRFQFLICKTSRKDMEKVAVMAEHGEFFVVVEDVFQFSDAVKAIQRLKTGRAKGKIIIKVLEGFGAIAIGD
ncbi:hypothetical protein M501DRAFT_989707 [Patellaria atrata CBS 101060]|uniref:Enoyl reductase (ER) domain-containing protein n=1 Tax=Patellaria atrata CBS 101060 TaxID=1346257 RepID=A0A9P4VRP3_9PEZI|nr:hypothetical protein M501DRAFT_989707 [Patellaria atrata CBS 101060]